MTAGDYYKGTFPGFGHLLLAVTLHTGESREGNLARDERVRQFLFGVRVASIRGFDDGVAAQMLYGVRIEEPVSQVCGLGKALKFTVFVALAQRFAQESIQSGLGLTDRCGSRRIPRATPALVSRYVSISTSFREAQAARKGGPYRDLFS